MSKTGFWSKIGKIDLEEAEASDLEDCFDDLIKVSPDDIDDEDDLRKAFAISQTLLVVRRNEFEAMCQEYETIHNASVEKDETIEMLRQEVAIDKRVSTRIDQSFDPGMNSEFRAQLIGAERKAEIYMEALKEAEDDAKDKSQIIDKQKNKIKKLENDFNKLDNRKKILEAEIADGRKQLAKIQSDRIMSVRKGELSELQERMKKSNTDFNNVLDENAMLLEENDRLRRDLDVARKEMIDAKHQMKKTTEEITQHDNSLQAQYKTFNEIQQENEKLKLQIEELLSQLQIKEQEDDEIMNLVSTKVEKWKSQLTVKDDDINNLKNEIIILTDKMKEMEKWDQVHNLNIIKSQLKERDLEVKELTKKLREATDLISSKVDNIRGGINRGELSTTDGLLSKIDFLETLNENMKKDLNDTEKEKMELEKAMTEKESTLVSLEQRMREYESGDYQLADAVEEIRTVKKTVYFRDQTIEKLVKEVNKLDLEFNRITDENEEFRNRLNLPEREHVDLSSVQAKRLAKKEEDRAMLLILGKEVEDLEGERIRLKKQLRNMTKQIGSYASTLNLTADDVVLLEQLTDDLRTRNEGYSFAPSNEDILKKFKEKLLSIKDSIDKEDTIIMSKSELELLKTNNQNFSSNSGDSKALKNLCIELKCELSKVKTDLMETISQLRKHQVRDVNGNEKRWTTKIIDQRMKFVKDDQNNLKIATSSRTIIEELNRYLVQTLHELSVSQKSSKELQINYLNYKDKYQIMKNQLGVLYKDFTEFKKELKKNSERDSKKVADLENDNELKEIKIEELEKFQSTIESSSSTDDMKKELSEKTKNLILFRFNEKSLKRRCTALEEIEQELLKEKSKLRHELVEGDSAIKLRLTFLEQCRNTSQFQIKTLQKQLLISVPQPQMEVMNRKFSELQLKYNEMLTKEMESNFVERQQSDMEEENKRLLSQTEMLTKQLEKEKEINEDNLMRMKNFSKLIPQVERQDIFNKNLTNPNELTTKTDVEKLTNRLGKYDLITGNELNESKLDDQSQSKRIIILEMKELNERQRADHAQKMYGEQRKLLIETEERNIELEKKINKMSKDFFDMQGKHVELTNELSMTLNKEEARQINETNKEFEKENEKMRTEMMRLRSIADIATDQVQAIKAIHQDEAKEMISLKWQLRNLQSKTDEKTEIGKLSRQIVSLQISEATALRNLHKKQKRNAVVETQIYRIEKMNSDLYSTIFQIRNEYCRKKQYLNSIIRDMRNRYGNVLPQHKQEELIKEVIERKCILKKIRTKQIEIEEDKFQLELKKKELQLQQESLADLLKSVKNDKITEKLMELQKKKLKEDFNEMRQNRRLDEMKMKEKFLENLINQQDEKLTRIEDERLELDKTNWEKQLIWEEREIELERQISQLESYQKDIILSAKQFEVASNLMPNELLTLPEQLHQSIENIRRLHKLYQAISNEKKKVDEKLEKLEMVNKSLEMKSLKKDEIINTLRRHLPNTNDRDIFLGNIERHSDRLETEDIIFAKNSAMAMAASSMVKGIEERLKSKEETILNYQKLIEQMKIDTTNLVMEHEKERKNLQQQIIDSHNRYIENLKDEIHLSLDRSLLNQNQLITEKDLERINELEEFSHQQNLQIAELNNEIKILHEQAHQLRKDKISTEDECQRAMDDVNRKCQDVMKSAEEKLRKYRKIFDEGLEELKVDLELNKTNKTNNKSLKDQLQNICEAYRKKILDKEREHSVVTDALKDARDEIEKLLKQPKISVIRRNSANDKKIEELLKKRMEAFQNEIENLKKELANEKKLNKYQKSKKVPIKVNRNIEPKSNISSKKLLNKSQNTSIDFGNSQTAQWAGGDMNRNSVRELLAPYEQVSPLTSFRNQARKVKKEFIHMRQNNSPNSKSPNQKDKLYNIKIKKLEEELLSTKDENEILQKKLRSLLYQPKLENLKDVIRNSGNVRPHFDEKEPSEISTDSNSSVRKIGKSGRSTKELELTIYRMKKIIEKQKTRIEMMERTEGQPSGSYDAKKMMEIHQKLIGKNRS
ncbi:hypothetical protein SNEBB_002671 [Seison nebaliae]|nr:hypothetical protein SNEBB_002671 [Seison nebaliae]